jgi:hypothetical protein
LKEHRIKFRLFADNCIIYRKILSISDVDKLQTDLDRLGECAVENEMKINPGKSKALSFTRAQVKDPLSYFFKDQRIPEPSCWKYLGVILCSDVSWAYLAKSLEGTMFLNAYSQKWK